MEEKLLKIALTISVENIIKEMRKFSKDPLNCHITICTRVNPEEKDPDKQCDTYYVGMNVEGCPDNFLDESKKVFRHIDPREGE